MITCCVRYFVRAGKEAEFEEYARRWIALIAKYGGRHLGCFVPHGGPLPEDAAHFSFPGIGAEGPDDVAIVLYSFPDLEAYGAYRRMASADPECAAAAEHFRKTECCTRYERTFVRRL
jgi:hypothetical protein